MAGSRRQRELHEDELADQDFDEATFSLEIQQGAAQIPSTVPQMQPIYQQGISDLEAVLFHARVGRISFNRTFDPLDFLHAVETRTQTAHIEY